MPVTIIAISSALPVNRPAVIFPAMSEIEIEAFRANTPASKGITAANIADVAAGYNADVAPAPVVMGHPAPGHDHSAPAFGAISGVRAEGDRLFVKIKNLAQEAVDGVRQSRILNRSVAFWHPQHPSNPTPGKFSLRHLGLLGGSPPAIPNLPPLRFAADDADTLLADGDPGAPMIYAAPDAPQEIDYQAVADKVAAIIKPAADPAPEPKPKGKEFAVADEAELKAREEELAKREADLKAKEAQFAADEEARAKQAKAAAETANTEFAAQLVKDGKFPAGHQQDLVQILNALPGESLTFSGDKSEAPADALKRILGAAEPVIRFEQLSPTGQPQFAAGGEGDEEAKALAEASQRQSNAWRGGQ